MDNNTPDTTPESEYVSKLTVAHTKDEFNQDRWFIEDEKADWIEGPFDSRDLAWAYIAKCHQAQRLVEA